MAAATITLRGDEIRPLSSVDQDVPLAGESTRRFALGIATQFALVLAAALAYFGVRGLTEGSEEQAVGNAESLLSMERWLNIDIEAGLQSLVLDQRAIITFANWVYIWGHWPVITLTLVWLYRRHRSDYFLLRNAMFVSGAIGLVIFALLPVAPPRPLPGGFVDTVTELSTSYRVLQPPALINEFAAVPSLHVGWNLLVGVMIYRASRTKKAKAFAILGPMMMTSAVVLTANHYVVDAVAGAAVALTGLSVAFMSQRVASRIRNHHTSESEATSGSCLNDVVWVRPGSEPVDELIPAA